MPAILYLAYFLRLGDWPSLDFLPWQVLPMLSAVSLLMLTMVGVYSIVVRAFNETLLRDLLIGLCLVSVYLYIMGVMVPELLVPKTVPIIFACLAFFWLWGSRTFIRAMVTLETRGNGEPVVIYGAGRAGRQLISALRTTDIYPLALLDDNPELIGSIVLGMRVNDGSHLLRVLTRLPAKKLLLAMPNLSPKDLRAIIDTVEPLNIKVCVVPGMDQLATGEVRINDIREIDIVDLLRRPEVEPDLVLLHRNTSDCIVLVTGAGGSIGSELCRQVAACHPRRLLLWDVTEYALYAIAQELGTAFPGLDVVPILGSVLEGERLQRIMRAHAVDTVYHAAAYKHVPLVETNPFNGVCNNVLGTWRAAQAARAADVATFVLISTDKAVRPTNVMGASKRLAEMFLQAVALEQPGQTRFVMVRFGNVLGSSGSVVPLFRAQIAQGGPITVTHPDITRYFMTIPEASQLVIQAGAMGRGGEVYVLDMGEPVKIVDLAHQMIQLSGRSLKSEAEPDGHIEVVFTGLRPGEKLYEELLIGDNVTATNHPRICAAHEEHLSLTVLDGVLEAIVQLDSKHDVSGLKLLLQGVVRGYVPDMASLGLCVDQPLASQGIADVVASRSRQSLALVGGAPNLVAVESRVGGAALVPPGLSKPA